jgi:hypothetical protein
MVTGPPDDADETVTDSAARPRRGRPVRARPTARSAWTRTAIPCRRSARAAAAAGRATGLVTTTSVTDASPAAFFASVPRPHARIPDRPPVRRRRRSGRDPRRRPRRLELGRPARRARAAGYRYADDAEALAAAGRRQGARPLRGRGDVEVVAGPRTLSGHAHDRGAGAAVGGPGRVLPLRRGGTGGRGVPRETTTTPCSRRCATSTRPWASPAASPTPTPRPCSS